MRSAGSRCSCSHACRLRIPTSTCAHGLESGHCQHLQRGLRFSLVLHQKVAQRRISRCKLAIRGRQSADHLPASRYPRVPRCDGTYRPRFATDSETTAALPVLFTSAAAHSHWSWAPAGAGPVVPSECRTPPPGRFGSVCLGKDGIFPVDAVFNRCRIN
jgi:hypothetical protein